VERVLPTKGQDGQLMGHEREVKWWQSKLCRLVMLCCPSSLLTGGAEEQVLMAMACGTVS
jgi:hypothetical protein